METTKVKQFAYRNEWGFFLPKEFVGKKFKAHVVNTWDGGKTINLLPHKDGKTVRYAGMIGFGWKVIGCKPFHSAASVTDARIEGENIVVNFTAANDAKKLRKKWTKKRVASKQVNVESVYQSPSPESAPAHSQKQKTLMDIILDAGATVRKQGNTIIATFEV